LKKIIEILNLAGDKNLQDSTVGFALPGGMHSNNNTFFIYKIAENFNFIKDLII